MDDMKSPQHGTFRRYGNRYTAFNLTKELYGRNAKHRYKEKRLTQQQIKDMVLAVANGTKEEKAAVELRIKRNHDGYDVMEVPKPKQKKRTKTRSDSGKKHLKRGQTATIQDDPMQEIKDLVDTQKEIKYWEAWEQLQNDRKSPRRIEIRKKIHKVYHQKMEKDQKSINGGVTNRTKKRHEERIKLLPPDRICLMCSNVRVENKKWCVLEFADGLHAICRSCYENIRCMYFVKDAQKCRAFFKCCQFSLLKEGLSLQNTSN